MVDLLLVLCIVLYIAIYVADYHRNNKNAWSLVPVLKNATFDSSCNIAPPPASQWPELLVPLFRFNKYLVSL